MNCERDNRNRPRLIGKQADRPGQFQMAEIDGRRCSGDRIGQRNGHGRLFELRAHGSKVEIDLREAVAAHVVFHAPREDFVDGPLRLECDIRAERQLWRNDTVEHDGPRRFRVAPRVVLRNTGAVRGAEQVQRRVAEFLAQGFEVLYSNARSKESRVVR